MTSIFIFSFFYDAEDEKKTPDEKRRLFLVEGKPSVSRLYTFTYGSLIDGTTGDWRTDRKADGLPTRPTKEGRADRLIDFPHPRSI